MFRITHLELEGPFRTSSVDTNPPPTDRVVCDLVSPIGNPVEIAMFGGWNGTGKTLLLHSITHALRPSATHKPKARVTGKITLQYEDRTYLVSWTPNSSPRWSCEGEPVAPLQVPLRFVPAPRAESQQRLDVEVGLEAPGRMRSLWERLHPKKFARFEFLPFTFSDPTRINFVDTEETRDILTLASGDLDLLLLAGAIEDSFDGILLIDTPELYLAGPYRTALGDHLRWIAPKAQILLGSNCGELWDQLMSFQRFNLNRPSGLKIHVSPTRDMRNPLESQAPLDMYLSPGFGGYTVMHDGQTVSTIQETFGVHEDELRLLDIEHTAGRLGGKWSVRIDAALWSATWERREDEGWVCTANGPGFA